MRHIVRRRASHLPRLAHGRGILDILVRWTMPSTHSVAQVYLHIVFSTKNRRPYLREPGIRSDLHHYLGGTSNDLGCPIIQVGGVADHVHILCRMGRKISIAELIQGLKQNSSMFVKTKGKDLANFYWQSGYGVFSLSPTHVERLANYIQHQEEHHRVETFRDELRRLYMKYGLEWVEDDTTDVD